MSNQKKEISIFEIDLFGELISSFYQIAESEETKEKVRYFVDLFLKNKDGSQLPVTDISACISHDYNRVNKLNINLEYRIDTSNMDNNNKFMNSFIQSDYGCSLPFKLVALTTLEEFKEKADEMHKAYLNFYNVMLKMYYM